MDVKQMTDHELRENWIASLRAMEVWCDRLVEVATEVNGRYGLAVAKQVMEMAEFPVQLKALRQAAESQTILDCGTIE